MKLFRGHFIVFLLLFTGSGFAQTTGSFTVNGDFDKYYPVTFYDGGWPSNAITELELGRNNVHENSQWRGALMAKFSYHTYAWGSGSDFISANINQGYSSAPVSDFIAGWKDGTSRNSTLRIIIWLRGGGTTYYYTSNYAVNPLVFDTPTSGVYYQEPGGPDHSYKTSLDAYVNSNGLSMNQSAFFQKPIKTSRLQVTPDGWSDFVFDPAYQLPSLEEIESYIKVNKHLPDVPSEMEVKEKGIDVGEMNRTLLQKVEELTLHLIEQNKNYNQLQEEIKVLKKEVEMLRRKP
ncbi:hypothetical protein [Chitinophaga tropicalis]|uniref:Uncharacterized protein n=1 Tax=Chitinophaga tropicalis TaxID=2683588 RepID=A0A7K1U1L6_9BACT|nr:hypothetical protein [Chitinophaga tropicalis]MVT08261.1 hypothetical protein [Chitinophaga tropicalis]